MLGVISNYLWYYMGDASECERVITKLATTGYSQREQADMEDYAIVHFLDNMAGRNKAYFKGHKSSISRVKDSCLQNLFFWCGSSSINRFPGFVTKESLVACISF